MPRRLGPTGRLELGCRPKAVQLTEERAARGGCDCLGLGRIWEVVEAQPSKTTNILLSLLTPKISRLCESVC